MSLKHLSPEERRARAKAYYWANVERYRKYARDHREKTLKKALINARKWRAKNKERVSSYNAEYAKKNADPIRVRTSKRRQKDKEKVTAWRRDWVERNRARVNALNRKRLAIKRGAEGNHTGDDISRLLKLQSGRCAYCRKKVGKKYHVDHILPLSRGGSNWPKNLQITCPSCNVKKSAKLPEVFARQEGRLL